MTVDQIILLYVLLLPINISIAAYSFEYYAITSKDPIRAIDTFDKSLRFPISFVFRKHRSLTFKIFAGMSKSADYDEHIFNVPLERIILPRRILILFSGLTIFAPVVGFFSLTETALRIAYVVYITAYAMTLISCMRFGKSMLTLN